MTSISQQPTLPSQLPNRASQQVQSSSTGGTSTPQAAVPAAPTGRSYANATKKPFSPSASVSGSAPSAAGSSAHGKSESLSPVNGRIAIPPAVPSLGGPTIVNGGNAMSPTSGPGDHSRKPSVTISAAGTTGHMSNGGPVVGSPTTANGIQFGSLNTNPSPAMTHIIPQPGQTVSSLTVSNPSNPRITSPQTSPSPIPQPPASGGRPPSSLQGQGNGISFGNLAGGEDGPRQYRQHSLPQGALTPGMQSAHLRRESSQPAHGDMGNSAMGPNAGRGGYLQQGGRGGRTYGPQYQQPQMPYSPQQGFRPPPNQPRGNQNMGQQYPNQGRPAPQPYPSPSIQNARSPSLPNAQLSHPQQMPMPSPHMPHGTPYGGYPQQMGPPQVNPPSSSASSFKNSRPNPRKQETKAAHFVAQHFFAPTSLPNLAPETGQFEQFLTKRQQNYQYGMPQQYDPNYAAMYAGQYMQHPGMQYMPPGSPRPGYGVAQPSQQHYVTGQYANQPAASSMSRTSSQVSDRPSPALNQPQTPMTPAVSHQTTASRTTNSPGPKSANFQIPVRKSAGIVIKDPSSGAVKTFDKTPASPAPHSKSPAIISGTPTPPPGTPSHAESHHSRNESKAGKTDEEKKNDMRDAIAKKIEADKEEERRRKEVVKADRPEEATKSVEEPKAEVVVTTPAAEEVAPEVDDAAPEEDAEAERLRKEKEEDEMYAEMERKEREAEEAYERKRNAEKEEKARKVAEAAAREEEDMKKAEAEAEAAEEARLKKLEETEGEDKKERAHLFAQLKEDPISPDASPPAANETSTESRSATPLSETSTMPPPRTVGGPKQKPAALKLETSKPVEAPQPSAALTSLRTARFLTIIDDATYPSGFASPNPALNTNAPMGRFRYDMNFLTQFQTVFIEKPSENWTQKVKETVGDTSETPASARGPRTSGMMTSRTTSNRTSVLPGAAFGAFNAFQSAARPQQSGGSVSGQGGQKSGQPIRYAGSNTGGFPMGFTPQMTRTASTTSLNHPPSPRNNPSHRGNTGGRGSKGGKPQHGNDKDSKNMPLTAGLDLKPIEVTATGWKPRSIGANAAGMAGPPPGGDGYLAPDVVQRKVKAALNKMTPNTFEKIAQQILDIVGQSKKETDGRTLRQVIQLTFEKATDEAHWAQMYANFCSSMLGYMTPEIKDETLPVDKNGNVPAGGTLFRKYLLNRCQQDFEAGWKAKLPDKPDGEKGEEVKMLSDEYYIAAAAKRRGLGLVRFIGELYKLGMLTSRIMHMCVKRLVDFEGMPDEAEVESLTGLLQTIGQALDSEEKARPSMDAYFSRINDMINVEGLPSRLRFMLMDIVELRRKGWKSKDSATKGPVTLEEVRAQAAAAEREREQQRAADNSRNRGGGGGGRMAIGRGDARNFSGGGGGMQPPPDYQRNTVGMDDLRRLGRGGSRQTSSAGTMSFGPTSMFNSRGSNTRRPLGPGVLGRGEDSGASSRTATPPQKKEEKETTNQNAFSALAALDSGETADQPNSPPSTASVAKSPLAESKDAGGAKEGSS